MIECDIDEILQWYNNFTGIIKQLSMSAGEQICKLQGTMVSDELATDFSEIGMPYARKLLSCEWISEEQFQLAEGINMKLKQMSEKKELWNDESLSCSPEWEECRKSGKELLSTLEK